MLQRDCKVLEHLPAIMAGDPTPYQQAAVCYLVICYLCAKETINRAKRRAGGGRGGGGGGTGGGIGGGLLQQTLEE